VTLIQGRVTVLTDPQSDRLLEIIRPRARRGQPSAPSISLNAGQQLIAVPAALPRVEVVSLERTGAWESGQLAFDDETLASVTERVSRYNRPSSHGRFRRGVVEDERYLQRRRPLHLRGHSNSLPARGGVRRR